MARPRPHLSLEFPVNPHCMKYVCSLGPSRDGNKSLKRALMRLSGVTDVEFGEGFVLIKKDRRAPWKRIHPMAFREIHKRCARSRQKSRSLMRKRVLGIVDRKIRPAVVMDGGELVLSGIRRGVVYLSLEISAICYPFSEESFIRGLSAHLSRVEGVRGVVVQTLSSILDVP